MKYKVFTEEMGRIFPGSPSLSDIGEYALAHDFQQFEFNGKLYWSYVFYIEVGKESKESS